MFDRRPKVAEIAARAKVSTATVDRVINGRGGVHRQTADKVASAISEMRDQAGKPSALREAARTFDVLLPAQSGRSTEVLAAQLTACASQFGATVRISVVERINPKALATRMIECMHSGTGGIAVQGVDHPEVRGAMEQLVRANVPVVTLCSDVTGVGRRAYIGVDNRAAGRTSGLLMGRFCRGPGKLAVVWGGQLYRSHEERETGFRAVLRHEHPDLQILEMVNGNDDAALNRSRMREVIERNPDLQGVYCIGGGQKGVAEALEQAGAADRIVMIGHNFNEETRPFLLSGTIDAIIHQNMERIARAALGCLLQRDPSSDNAGIPIEIVTRENML